ncbi:hypothetical protein OXX79_000840 [Metschnikowia pulcherrima]
MDPLHHPLNAQAASPEPATSSHLAASPPFSTYTSSAGHDLDQLSPSPHILTHASSFAYSGPDSAIAFSHDAPSQGLAGYTNEHRHRIENGQNGQNRPNGQIRRNGQTLGSTLGPPLASPVSSSPYPTGQRSLSSRQHIASSMHQAPPNFENSRTGAMSISGQTFGHENAPFTLKPAHSHDLNFSNGSNFNAYSHPSPMASRPVQGSPQGGNRSFDQFQAQFATSHDDLPVQHVIQVSGQGETQHVPAMTSARFQNLQKGAEQSPATGMSASSSSASTISGLEPPKKKPRADTQQDTERHLVTLAGAVSAAGLAESAAKVRAMASDAGIMKNDPIFGQLCNPKDLKQDRHHQIFALAWLSQACEAAPAAVVPRNRIYARYVQMCGEYTLGPLMPAAFGRLVRLLFPNLTTRRLGMRGKSKYHYCGVKLRGDHNSQAASPLSAYSSVMGSPPSNCHTPSQTESPGVVQKPMFATPVSVTTVQDHFLVNDYKYVPSLYGMVEQSIAHDHEHNRLTLPSIHAFLPRGLDFDPDIADTLGALVKIQCTATFESIRYMKKDDLFRALVPSPAILSGPSFKLLNLENAVEWAGECDKAMYRAMAKMLSRLHLKGASKDIVAILREICQGFVAKLAAALGDRFSSTYKAMKLKLARQFIKLVSRLLRCIETGFRASIVLANGNDRNNMLQDWVKLDFSDTVLREIPCCPDTAQSIIHILEHQVVQLLQEPPQDGAILARYASFLFDLPALFPKVNPWLFSLLLSNLLTSFIREMSMVGSRSFKLWWIVGCWINEYMSWSFELSGYLYDEFCPPHDESAMGFDLGISLSANISGITDFHGHEKSVSSVDLLAGEHDPLQ